MEQVTVEEAGTRLAELIRQARSGGEEVIITEDDQPIARLVPLPHPRPRPRFGSARGLFHLADDFDAPLEDFDDYR
jgi:prevent-host-death family protein